MPAKSKAQYKLMKAAENNPEFAKKIGISQEKAKEFTSKNVGEFNTCSLVGFLEKIVLDNPPPIGPTT